MCVCVRVHELDAPACSEPDQCDLFPRSVKLSKHERQGDSVTEREGGNREEGAWKTPQAAPGEDL